MPVVPLVIGCSLLVCAAILVYLWSRWAGREAAYEPEPLLAEEAAIEQTGTHLRGDQTGIHRRGDYGGFNG